MAGNTKPSSKAVFQMIDAALKMDPSKSEGSEGVYQFNLTGDDGGTYQMIIDENGGKAIEGTEKEPDCTLEISADDYKNMVAGTLNPTEAFMSGQLKIDGDIGLALKLQNILNSFTA
ncbi:sterol-binding protein [Pueribacillus theae]|uniref:Sterol-binding protein n=1 Tax=Pueribacillus theae TaxID=2171751 RepID=A0A2U1K672_9BACI|nr:SCP2 sterol-binding domain-containing protein [Pueribacillus theae]PWA13041.1 sterol-binding protein [Pueribacillus theae]